jgi:hypothetical protein
MAETMSKVLSDVFLWEIAAIYSRDTVVWDNTIAAPAGTLVKIASGKHTPAAAGDAAAVVGILFTPAAVGDTQAVVVKRGAIVKRSGIQWPASATDANKTALETALVSLGVIVR